ncbi:MAG: anaerobic carbon-monoxide dehydrogenase catalytic subunit [Anaerolineae bacterium]
MAKAKIIPSIDPAACQVLEFAEMAGITTAFARANDMKPCPIGSSQSGICCKNCYMGPCRLTKDGQVGICGATVDTIAARNFARAVAAGAAAHSDHGRDLAFTLQAAALNEAAGYTIRDEAKLLAVAAKHNIPTRGRSINEIALDVANKAISEFGQQRGELSNIATAPAKRQAIWREHGIVPRGIDREVVDILHRTHMGDDQDPEHILAATLRTALADGWGGSMWATDISDILFGTPSPIVGAVNLGVLREDEVNIIVHGHEPTLSEMIVAAVQDPELIEFARSKGARGINLAGICCTSNEILLRQGVPSAGNFLHQELAILTGAVEAMVVDVQCIMQSLIAVASNFHTEIITTSPKVKITGATHIEFDEHHAPEIAKDIVRRAIENYPNRGETRIPEISEHVVPGFSHEYLNYMLGGYYRASFRPLNDAIAAGRIRGVVADVGCNNPHTTQDKQHMEIISELLKNDVLVVSTGCGAIAAGKYGFLRGEAGLEKVGPGLREICEAIGIPPVLHMGSCVDNSRILTVLTQMATEGGLGDDISDIPAVGLAPEWMSEKALAIASYCVASGAYVIMGIRSPVEFSDKVTEIISKGWEAQYGGKLEFVSDSAEVVRRVLEHIDKKRAALKLPPYDPSRFGQSGDVPLQPYFELPLEEQMAELYG